MRVLFFVTLTVILFGCSNNTDTSASTVEGEKQTKTDISFVCKESSDGTKVFLVRGDKERYVTSISSPGLVDISQEDFKDYDISESVVIAASSFWSGMSEVLYVIEKENEYVVYYSERDEMEEGDYQYAELRTISFQDDHANELYPPYYIINTAAVKSENDAKQKAKELEDEGYFSGYLWIPDYASLSGAEYYTVYIGPFKTKQECALAVDQYRIENPKAYGTLVSHKPGRVTVGGIEDAMK